MPQPEETARAEMQRVPVQTLDFGFVPSVVYETHAYYEPGAIGALFHMVHAFLYAVQPNPFPKGEETATWWYLQLFTFTITMTVVSTLINVIVL